MKARKKRKTTIIVIIMVGIWKWGSWMLFSVPVAFYTQEFWCFTAKPLCEGKKSLFLLSFIHIA